MSQPPDMPAFVVVPIRVNEPATDFCRRILIEAARSVGLPPMEQQHFAAALMAQYPSIVRRRWENDPTPRDGTAEVKPDDFNYLLLRRYLNDNRQMRGQRISLDQIQTVVGSVLARCPLDDVTRDELSRWRQDFIFRGGTPDSGVEAPISRSNLVPPLQTPATTPDITWIPQIMRRKNWNEGATLMEEWFRRPSNIRPARIEDTPNNFGPPLLNAISMNWVLSFDRAKSVYDLLVRERIWQNAAARPVIGAMLARIGVVARARAAGEGQRVSFGDLNSANVVNIAGVQIQYREVKESGGADALTAALANFTFQLAIKGFVTLKSNAIEVTVEEVGVFVKDSYDFINDGTRYWSMECFACTDQPLGDWEQGVGYVSNNTFNNWRAANNRGGDFLIYSDIRVIRLRQPDVFTVPTP